jgi:trehalose synthase
MKHLEQVRISPKSFERFAGVLGEEALEDVRRIAASVRERLKGRVVWNVNSTSVGGGVAEMLRSLLGYSRGVGVDSRWVVIRGDPEFFRITKRLHHALHGARGDGSGLGSRAREIYEETMRVNSLDLCARVQAGDIVVLHDPQTAGLAPHLARSGAIVIWRCHIGHDAPTQELERGWRFLLPYLEQVPAYVFSRSAYVPPECDHRKTAIIQPSIDAFSPKNQDLSEAAVRTILVHVGLLEGPPPPVADHLFRREDGAPGRVERRADVIRLGRAPSWERPLVVQISRWDSLKDPVGVLRGFAAIVEEGMPTMADLVLAGPNVNAVADDPEATSVFDEVLATWRGLSHAVRDRVHLVSLPTADVEENAAIVNALQRHSSVVVQKSLHEGFGLTVTEAMWKKRAVVASAVGGIQDQIQDGLNGILLKDPTDLAAFGAALRRLLEDPGYAARLGEAAHERVREQYLGVRHLVEYSELFARLDRAEPPAAQREEAGE